MQALSKYCVCMLSACFHMSLCFCIGLHASLCTYTHTHTRINYCIITSEPVGDGEVLGQLVHTGFSGLAHVPGAHVMEGMLPCSGCQRRLGHDLSLGPAPWERGLCGKMQNIQKCCMMLRIHLTFWEDRTWTSKPVETGGPGQTRLSVGGLLDSLSV